MAKIIRKSLVRSFFQSNPGEDSDILKGVLICELGEAKGHGFYLGDKFLDQVVLIGNRKQIKVRVDHPDEGKTGKVLSIIGQAFNFIRDGDKVRADVRLFDLPAKQIIKQLAKQANELFGMSLDFVGKVGKKLENGLEEIFCKDIDAVDFVEAPAATNSLFSEKVDSEKDDESQTYDQKQNSNFMDKEILAALGLEEGADDKSIKAAILAACEAKKTLAEQSDKKDDEKGEGEKEEMAEGDEEKKDEEKDKEVKASAKKDSFQLDDKKLAELVSTQVAKQFTALLAKTGMKNAKVSESESGKEAKADDANFGFSEIEVSWAKRNNVDLKSWRATLNKAAEKTFKFQSK
jgi:hypothetical protein